MGDFLKELDLTEGKATGFPTVFKELKKNGSPEPRFNTDNDRTFFEVELYIHPAFKTKSPFTTDLSKINWSLAGINELLNQILENAEIIEIGGIAGGIVDDIAGDIAGDIYDIDSQAKEVVANTIDDIADDIAKGIVGSLTKQQIGLLELCKEVKFRDELFQFLNLAKHPTNFKLHIKPLIDLDWLTMTIPNKPTSPNQQYRTTLKGHLVLEFLKHQKAKK